jgi:hypothetical protein
MESNAIAMIVPYYWNQSRFPTKSELDAGYREYLITQNNFNTHVPDFYWSINGTKNKDDNSLTKNGIYSVYIMVKLVIVLMLILYLIYLTLKVLKIQMLKL